MLESANKARLRHGVPAIDEEDLARDEIGRIGGKVDNRAGDIVDVAKPAQRICLSDLFLACFHVAVTHQQKEIIESFHRNQDAGVWPIVTTQIPIYNEQDVARRIIEAVAAIDYPIDKHEIQVLDDSNDHTCLIVV